MSQLLMLAQLLLAAASAVGIPTPGAPPRDDRTVCTAIDAATPAERLRACSAALSERATNDEVAAKFRAHRGLARGELGDAKGAIGDLNAAIEAHPAAVYFYWRGLTRHRIDEFDAAVADYTRAIKLDPDMPAALINRSILLQRVADFAQGIADTSNVLKKRPDHVMALSARASSYAMSGKLDEAEADLTKVERLAPNFSQAILIRAMLDSMRRRFDMARARIDLLRGQVGPVGNLLLQSLLVARAETLTAQRKFDEALADLRAAREASKEPEKCAPCLGVEAVIAVRQRDASRAEPLAARALTLAPGDRYALGLVCFVRAAGSDPARGAKTCTEVSERFPQMMTPILNRGSAYVKLGNLDAALKDYSTVLKMGDWTGGGRFGRGVVFSRRGDHAKADVEFALATAVNSDVAFEFDVMGIRPTPKTSAPDTKGDR